MELREYLMRTIAENAHCRRKMYDNFFYKFTSDNLFSVSYFVEGWLSENNKLGKCSN